MIRSLAWLLMSLAYLSFVAGCEQASAPKVPATGAPAAAEGAGGPPPPNTSPLRIQFRDYDGIQELIKSHEGKVVVMDCWSTWCEPCKKEFPGLVALHKKYGPDKVACISLCLDFEGLKGETPEEHEPVVRKFLEEQKATFDNVISSEASDELYKKLDVSTVPVVFVYDQKGELAKQFKSGSADDKPFTYEDIGETVASLVESP